MNGFLILAFLFFIGSVTGWVIELLFRRFFSSANPERKWINPGFCVGPYVPLYGFGLCILYSIAQLEAYSLVANPVWNRVLLFLFMAIAMTAIEYIAGIVSLKVTKVRLWDYFKEWGNIQGIICPKFSLVWAALGALYYFLIHPHILDALDWLSRNLAFSFVVGLFFGVFLVDVCYSTRLVARLKKFAEENDVILRYETLKAEFRRRSEAARQKYHFFHPLPNSANLSEHLQALKSSFEKRKHKKK